MLVSAFASLERVFHERGRLAICSALVAEDAGLSFRQLQSACGLTDGNLNRHLHALAELGIIEMSRKTGQGRPQTIVTITETGRDRFLAYIDALEEIVRRVQAAADGEPNARPARLLPE
ncbi:MAG: transcriptional regulator [Candidatus Eremiobacteraeota bacterium]|nr:transcriptional regulator [Candidatus Eremiobacteraeota bacterium]